MSSVPHAACEAVELSAGVSAVAPGLLWLHNSRALVAADVHFGYEDAVGAMLPAWSTSRTRDALLHAITRYGANELILLGDVVHSTRLSERAARSLADALDTLRAAACVTIIAGNHEGRSRGRALLGETLERTQRDGWLLLHGDRPPELETYVHLKGAVVGHFHPSLALGGRTSVPVFAASSQLVALPALTPYSNGLNVCSRAFLDALAPYGIADRSALRIVAATDSMLYPFGSLAGVMRLRPDG